MQLQTLVEEMGLREAPPLLPVLSGEGVGEVVRGYAGRVFGGEIGDGNGNEKGRGKGEGEGVDVRRDLLGLGTCTFVSSSPFSHLSPLFFPSISSLLSSLLIP